MTETKTLTRYWILAWSIFITGILYYCLAYLLRVVPSVMEPELLSHFRINASSFGILTTAYYFAYAPLQLPVGVTVDHFGARKSLIFASAMAIIGVLIFSLSDVFAFAVAGNFLIGFGSAFAYVTALKIATVWLPRKYFATATGVVTGAGMTAAIFTDVYLTHLVQTSGYRFTMSFAIITAVVLFFLILLLVRKKPKQTPPSVGHSTDEKSALTYRQLGQCLWVIMKKPQMWVIGAVGALLYLPASVFTDTWGIPYLETVYKLSPEKAGYGIAVMLIGWIASSFATGALSDILGTRKIPLLIGSMAAAIIAAIIFYLPGISVSWLYILLFLFGFACGPHPLCFALSKEGNTVKASGTSVAFTNFVIMMGGFIFKPIVGSLLDISWTGTLTNGLRLYTKADYTFALSFLPLGLIGAFVLTLFIKETYQRAVKEEKATDC